MSGYRVGQTVQGTRAGTVTRKRKHGQTTIYTVDWEDVGKLDHSYFELRQLLTQPNLTTIRGIRL